MSNLEIERAHRVDKNDGIKPFTDENCDRQNSMMHFCWHGEMGERSLFFFLQQIVIHAYNTKRPRPPSSFFFHVSHFPTTHFRFTPNKTNPPIHLLYFTGTPHHYETLLLKCLPIQEERPCIVSQNPRLHICFKNPISRKIPILLYVTFFFFQ